MAIDYRDIVQEMQSKRIEQGLSIRSLADQIGVSFSCMARWERGDGLPDYVSAAKILHWLGKMSDSELETIVNAFRQSPARHTLDIALRRIEDKIDKILDILEEMK